MKKNSAHLTDPGTRISRRRTAAAFFIPLLALLMAFAAQGVFPFGDRHILTVDLYHQYAPFLGDLREKLLTGSSLFFSWRGGLGINFFSLFAYYAASPLNIITVLFPESMLSEMVLTLVLLKVGLAGAFFHLFLKKAFRRDGPVALAFSVAYALNGYILAYFWNIMWLDSVALLPLLALSLVYLIRENKCVPYALCLALVIYSNYYSGFFACAFIALYFWVLLERFGQRLRPAEKAARASRFLFSSLIGAGISMFTVLPTIYALQQTSAAGDSFPSTFNSFNPFIDFFARFLPIASPSIRDGMANIFCGSFILILIYLYMRCQRIRPQRKFLTLGLMAFLMLSLNNNVLNFLWHGMHYPNQLPYRNAYVLCFFVLTVAYDMLPELRLMPAQLAGGFFIGSVLILFILQKIDTNTYNDKVLISAFVILGLYALLFSSFMRKYTFSPKMISPARRKSKAAVLSVCLSAVIVAEMSLNAFFAVHQVAEKEYFGLRENYMSGEEPAAIRRMITKHEHDNGAHELTRIEILPDHCVNDAMLYRTNGLTIFSSTMPKVPVHAMAALGFPNNGINSFQYQGSTPVIDAILGIRYLIRREKPQYETRIMKEVDHDGNIALWENPYALPLAFLADARILPDPDEPAVQALPVGNAFAAQSALLYQLSGVDSPFTELHDFHFLTEQDEGLSIIPDPSDKNRFEVRRDDRNSGSFELELPLDAEGEYYVYWKTDSIGISGAWLYVDAQRERLGTKSQNMAALGFHEAGENLKLRFEFPENTKNKTSSMTLRLARLDEDSLDEAMRILKAGSVTFMDFSSRSFKLRAQAEKDSSLFVSSIYDPGWRAYIDGKPVKIERIYEGFMALPFPKGEHEISFSFVPQGFKEGLIISCASLIICLLLFILERKKGKRRPAISAEHPYKSEEKLPDNRPRDDGFPVFSEKRSHEEECKEAIEDEKLSLSEDEKGEEEENEQT